MNASMDSRSAAAADSVKGERAALSIALAGVILTGAVAGWLLVPKRPARPLTAGTSATMTTIKPSDLEAAASTLNPWNQAALLSGAKACREPLAVVTLSRAQRESGGQVQIRSGTYLSPFFSIGSEPTQIAIPFPSGYSVGHGVISVEGKAAGVQLALYPLLYIDALLGKVDINVDWQPNKPCAE
jgi:hypothetical protein